MRLYFLKLFCALLALQILIELSAQDAPPLPVPPQVQDQQSPAPPPVPPAPPAPKRLRTAEVIQAEICKYDPTGTTVMQLEAVKETEAIALLSLKLDKGRSLSVFDYVLTDSSGATYQTAAIRLNDAVFDGSQTELKSDGTQIYTLLFFVPPQNGEKISFNLKNRLLDDFKDSLDLDFTVVTAPTPFSLLGQNQAK